MSGRRPGGAGEAFRIAAIDMDGTLLRSDGTISARTRMSLSTAIGAGIEVLVVSARPPRIIREYCERLSLEGLALCCNGAIVYDPRRHAVVDSVTLDAVGLAGELRGRIPGVVLGWECGLGYGCDGGFILEHHFDGGSTAIDAAAHEVNKVLVHHPTLPQEELRALIEDIVGSTGSVTISGHDVVEVTAPGVTKASAVARFAELRGTDLDSVVAFGDMPNDMPLLEQAGLGIAVQNAPSQVHAVADEVTASNDDDGVAIALERLVADGCRWVSA